MANITNSNTVPAGKQMKNTVATILGKITGFREGTLILIIIAVCILMSFLSPYFMTWNNWRATFLSFATEGIVVVGMTIMLILGGIDLSVGGVMCLAMCIAGKLFLSGLDPWLASGIALVATGGIGAIMGLCVTKVGLEYFITTLAFMGITRGACFVITQGTPLSLFTLPDSFKFIGQGAIGPLPFVIIIFLVIVLVSDYMLRNSTLLRKVFYAGSNEKAAIFSGIRVNKVKIGVSILCSVLAGLAGVIYMSRFGASTPGFGVGLEMTAISAAVIGGASLNGGEGTVFGSILGIALLSIITSSLILLDVSVYWQDLIKGLILLFAVAIDHLQHAKKRSR